MQELKTIHYASDYNISRSSVIQETLDPFRSEHPEKIKNIRKASDEWWQADTHRKRINIAKKYNVDYYFMKMLCKNRDE